MSAHAVTELRFDPPGPGFWEQDAVHFPRPVSRYWAEMHPEPFKRGFRELTSYYGMLIDTLDYRYLDGFAYKTVVPVPDSEIPARFQRAEEALQGKLWREQLREWDETFKPTSISRHRELQSIDPDALSDEELVAYLTRCRDHHIEMIYQHMRHTGAAMLPTGDFLAHVGDWTGFAAFRAARLDARRVASVLGRFGGARATNRGDRRRRRRPTGPRVGRRRGRGAGAAALARGRGGGGRVGVSRSGRIPAARRLRHLGPLRPRDAGHASPGDPCRRGGGRAARRRTRMSRHGSRTSATGCRRSIAPSSTTCLRRPGSLTVCATSAASSATSGRRGSCAGLWSPAAAGSRRRGASRTQSTSSTPTSRR